LWKNRNYGTLATCRFEARPGPGDQRREKQREEKIFAGGSAQRIEKAHFGQENPRKSTLFPLIGLARAWAGFAGFG
jgi:hypothetical protein